MSAESSGSQSGPRLDAGVSAISLPDGRRVPRLGLGTWGMGERGQEHAREVRALQAGIDLGMTLIDTAEMYAGGGAEEVVGEAIRGRRDSVFLVSKVLPHNATRQGTVAACERSLKRLGVDHIDLYLHHWRGRPPMAETVAGLEDLKAAGKIGGWGVSNYDVDDCEELAALVGEDLTAGRAAQVNQVLYNLARRGIEFDLIPWSERHGLPIMAYSPIEQGRLLKAEALAVVAGRHEVTPAQVALAWVLRQPEVIAIPKASSEAHLRDNRAAADLQLTSEDLAVLDEAFPPPTRAQPLEMI